MRELALPNIFLSINDAPSFRVVVSFRSLCVQMGKITLHGSTGVIQLYFFSSTAQLSSGTCPPTYKKGELPECCDSVEISSVKSCKSK